MLEQKVSYDQAQKEVEAWLDAKNINQRKRDNANEAIASLIDAVMYGQAAIDADTRVITHNLAFPISDDKGNVVLDKLTYKPRLSVGELKAKSTGITGTDSDTRLLIVCAALSGQSVSMVGKMDTSDNVVAQAVGVFFL